MKRVLEFIAVLALSIAILLFNAWVLQEMYNLCVVPFGVPKLTYKIWFEISFLLSFILTFKGKVDTYRLSEFDGEVWTALMSVAATRLFYVLLAWVFNIVLF